MAYQNCGCRESPGISEPELLSMKGGEPEDPGSCPPQGLPQSQLRPGELLLLLRHRTCFGLTLIPHDDPSRFLWLPFLSP